MCTSVEGGLRLGETLRAGTCEVIGEADVRLKFGEKGFPKNVGNDMV